MELVLDLDQNQIIKALPFPLEDALERPEALRGICDKFRASRDPSEAACHINAVSYILFDKRYEECMLRKDAAKEFDRLVALEWDIFKSVPTQRRVQQLQRKAFSLGKKDLVKQMFGTYVKYFLEFQKMIGSYTQVIEMTEKDTKAAEAMMLDYKQRPEVHRALTTELLSVPTEFNEAIAFCTKQVVERVDMLKRTLELMSGIKTKEANVMLERFYISTNLKIIIGAATTLLHDLLAIKRATGNRRKELVDEILIDLTNTLGIYEYKLPSPINEHLSGIEPFSQEWMYLKFRLFSFACHSFFTVSGAMEKHLHEIQAQEPLSFILLSRLLTALRPFSSNFGKSSIPYIVFDPVNDGAYRMSKIIGACLQEKMKTIVKGIMTPRRNRPTIASIHSNFYKNSLPNAYIQCVSETGSVIFLDPTEAEMQELLNQNGKKKNRKPRTRNRAVVVQEFDVEPTLESIEPKIAEHIEGNSLQEAIEDTKAIASLEVTTRIVDFKELMKPQIIPIEYDEDEASKWTETYQNELDHYNRLVENLEVMSAEDLVANQSCRTIAVPETIDTERCFIAKWSTQDFLELFPEAAKVYNQNVLDCTAVKALHKQSLRFEWVFNPTIKIDTKTFRFLSRVFGLQPGGKDLTFLNFQRAFILLNGGSSVGAGSKNRTVFSFSHAFVVEDRVAVLPIRGVHPEHLSSRFNHIQIKGFLENGGFHPYFFRLIEA